VTERGIESPENRSGVGQAIGTFVVSVVVGAVVLAATIPNHCCCCASRSTRMKRADDRAAIERAARQETMRVHR